MKGKSVWQAFYVLFVVSVFVFLIFHILSFIYFLRIPGFIESTDFVALMTSGLMVRKAAGAQIYDYTQQAFFQKQIITTSIDNWILPFKWPPFIALLFVPFSFYVVHESYILFSLFNLVILAVFIFLAVRTFPELRRKYILLILPLSFYPIALSFIKGQIILILVTAWLVTYKLVLSKRYIMAGLVFSILFIKPQYYFLGLSFLILIRERKKFLIGALSGLFVLILISIYISGYKALISYPTFLASIESVDKRVIFSEMVNLFSVFLSLGKRVSLLLNAFLYLTALFVMAVKSQKISFTKLFVVTSIFLPIFSIHTFPYDLGFILIAIFILLNRAFAKINQTSIYALILANLLFWLGNITFAKIVVLNPILFIAIGFLLLSYTL